MNILFINTHDTGRYIEPYGFNIPTPNLMKLAQEGTIFRNAYCAGPTCSPSRAGLLTGMSPHSCGMIGLAHRGFQMNDYSKHLVQYLKKHDYKTVLCGIQHEAPKSDMIGYDRILTTDDRDMGRGTKFDSEAWDIANANAVANYISSTNDEKYFISFGIFNPHREFPQNKAVNPNYVQPPFPLPDNRQTREDMAEYINSAGIMDRCVGIVLDALKKSGKEDETVIIFTTDHGIAFPMMKCNLYDTGIGVSLIIKYPGNKMKGEAVDALISQLDIFPTLCDLITAEKPEWLEGFSLMPVFEGKAEEVHEHIFSEVTYHAAYEPMRCIRSKRYKLIRFYDEHESIVPANIDKGYSKDFLLDNGYLEVKRERELLFDLYFDPAERQNLADKIEYAELHKELSGKLDFWMRQTKDPLLKGHVPKPEGAVVNKITCISAGVRDYE